ncbi:hypothetical protein, partial [Streptomyces sp. NRRL F-5126]
MSLQNYSLEEAAGLLKCRVRYLKDNLDRLPHQKIGVEPVFDDGEILAIKDMHRVRPANAWQDSEPSSGPLLALASIQP